MTIIRKGGQWLIVLMLAILGVRSTYAQSPVDSEFLSTLGELREASFPDKESIVERLTKSAHPSVRSVLTAFMDERLFYRNDDQKIVIVKSTEGDPPTLDLIDPLTLKESGSAPVDSLTKILTNNGLRRMLRTTIARFGLSSPDASVRTQAVRDMLNSLDESTVAMLRERLPVETDSKVRKE